MTDPNAKPRFDLEERREERGRLPGDRVVRIVRPFQKEFRRVGPKRYRASEEILKPSSGVGGLIETLRGILVGRRIATADEATERVSKKIGLAIFASDNISSSAYATEEATRVLMLAGVAGLALTVPITISIIVVLAIVALSYLQTIRAYPNGGGSYVVAGENLGTLPGLVAGAALLVDYILTVSVSVAAGVAAIGSASLWVHDNRVAVGLGVIALLTLGNLRGIRESGNIFAAPTYLYLASVGGLILFGLWRLASGALPEVPSEYRGLTDEVTPLTALLILRAFSSGAVALTGTEAVANGVPAFRPPEARNAGIVLVLMATCFGALFLGISVLSASLGIVPDPHEQETLLSRLASVLVGNGAAFYVIQIATALILLLAANTSFNGFPRLASILANDRFMPRQFAFRGDRLAFSTGILALALLSSFLLAAYAGSVTSLIPLYTIGVFVAFTLSQAGMVRRWLRVRGRGWRPSLVLNAVGAVATGVVAIVVGVSKFEHGAWMVVTVIPVLVWLLYRVRRHYRAVEDALTVEPSDEKGVRIRPIVVVPVGRLDRAVLRALAVARGLSPEVLALHVTDAEGAGAAMQRRWDLIVRDVPLTVIESPYRSLVPPLLRFVDRVDPHDAERPIIVVLSEFVPRHWWEVLLHNQTALLLKLRLFFRPNTIVVDAPFSLRGAEIDDGADDLHHD